MSRFLSAEDASHISDFLSAPRLRTFLDLTRSGQREDAIELHQATMTMGTAILAVTSLIEVALRNVACRQLDRVFGRPDWLRNPPETLRWSDIEKRAIKTAEKNAQRAAYSKMAGPDKAALDAVAFKDGQDHTLKHKDLAVARQRAIQVSDGQIVAQLTMHFWKRMFSESYEAMLWKRGLKRAFPNKSLTRAEVAVQLDVIYEIRNRLAHHEPVYGRRLEAILGAISFACIHLGNRDENVVSPFAKLILPQREVLLGQVAIMEATFERLTRPSFTAQREKAATTDSWPGAL
ncbi:MAG: hypothetical protein H3C51_12615 [Rubellimicrobium sp.]|nr:hypothetical protein [Rubellimicrobium sp.]